jgi:Domain of unknown function (DUF4124)
LTTPEIGPVRKIHGTLLLALLGTAAWGADIYRSTAPDGTVTYSDRPEGQNSVYVSSVGPQGPAAAPARATPPANNPAAAPVQAPGTPTAPEGPSAAELRAQRQKNCDIARETQQRYTLSRRLFRTNAAGEREYLSDEEVAQARAKAAADVRDWCG